LLGVLLVGIVSSILVIPFVVIGLAVSGVFSGHTPTGTPVLFLLMAALGTLVAQTITAPLQASILALLYVDRRIRVEALDVTLAAAAAAP
jgi:hypothetical protein